MAGTLKEGGGEYRARPLTLKGRGGGHNGPHNFKTSIFQKMSPQTYPENS